MSWFGDALRTAHDRHERLKNFVHNGMRVPLPRWGRNVMGFVYFTIPVIAGWNVMMWAISKSEKSIGENGERLPVKEIQGIGDKRVGAEGQTTKLGAGGLGGGVHLAVSDDETQRQNREALEKFFRHERRKRAKQARQQKEQND